MDFALKPGRQPDRQARTGLDDGRDQLVAEGLGRAVLDRGLAMRQLVGAEGLDRLAERGVGGAEALGLALAMLVDHLLDCYGAGRCEAGRRQRRKTSPQSAVMPSEAKRFHPAIDTPNSDHCTRSHSTAAVPRICRFMSSSVIAPVALAVQALGPANQCCSTPTW